MLCVFLFSCRISQSFGALLPFFAKIHRVIGRAHDIIEWLVAAGRTCRTAVRRDHPVMERQTTALFEQIELDLLPGVRDFSLRDVLEDDDELVAADACRHGVLPVKDAAQDVCERDEQAVARLVAERVADVLEMVEAVSYTHLTLPTICSV